MAFLFCDGCDSYTTMTDVFFKWPGSNGSYCTYNATAGKFGQGALTLVNANSQTPAFLAPVVWPVTNNGLNAAMWIKSASSGVSVGGDLISLTTDAVSGSTFNALYGVSANGKLAVQTTAASPIVTDGNIVVTDGAYHWIEYSIKFSTTGSGFIKTYVDGVLDINYSGTTCGTSSYLPANVLAINILPAGWTPNGVLGYVDDVIIWDTSTASFNSFPLGAQRISTLVPSGNGLVHQYTPSGGTNWQCVNGGYDSTSFVSGSTTGLTDLYTYPAMGYTPFSINAVVENIFGQNSGSGSISILPTVHTGSTTATGASIMLHTGVYALSQTCFTGDATLTAWTVTTVNSSQTGFGD